MEKTMRSKTQDYISVENGNYLAKMPTATAEQLNIAKILSKPKDEVDLRKYVSQLQELTACTEDQAVTALYDCENNLERAVELLLDKLRFGNDEEWYTTGKKQPRPKHSSPNDSEFAGADSLSHGEHDHTLNDKSTSSVRPDSRRKNDSVSASGEGEKVEVSEVAPRKRDNRRRGSAGGPKLANAADGTDRQTEPFDTKSRPPIPDASESKPRSRLPGSDAWDPYTEYGGWGGEAIEVINSNASISRGLQEEVVLPEELLVDTGTHDTKAPSESHVESDAHSTNDDISPKSINFADSGSIFITKASSKLPPPAFNNFPDIPVFIVPEILPQSIPKWPFKFCGELCSSYRNVMAPSLSDTTLSPKKSTPRTLQPVSSCSANSRSELESQTYSQFVPSPPSKTKTNNFEMSKPGGSRSLLETPSAPDAKADLVSTAYPTNHFQNTNAPKVTGTFSAPQKVQPSTAFGSDNTNSQSNFLESSLKNYILDNLPSEMSKLSVSETTHSAKVTQYNLQTPVPQTQQASVSSSFAHNPGASSNSMSHSVNKAQMSHLSTHGSIHGTQQPVVSGASQSHQQQSAPVPPGMPHFIGQFAPPAYMFNLPGSSGNAPTIFDLDQFQLLQQQQRMLYDMHLQQQAATTAQSLLTSSTDVPTSSKSTTHSLPGTLGHVTAANAGIRPDLLASAMGHAPQMLPPGHPYFSYPGFVLMNGYSNAFLNQQQQQQSGQDGNQSQAAGAGHGSSPITQHQQQPNSSAHSYSGLKSVNNNVTGYDDLFDMKYGDPAKQVGFKNSGNPNYGSFQGQIPSTDVVGSKLSSAAHSNSGVLTQGFNANSGSGQPFSPQFYPSAPYLTAAAVAVAAAAAASAQQQQQVSHAGGPVSGTTNQSNAGVSSVNNSGTQGSVGGGAGPNALHPSNNASQSMVLGSSGSNLHAHHHQRSVMPQQY